ncbi:MAG TPA: class I SAM-dependent methyltransferase [Alphaproteobacteria bacterium]|jgi:cyclopropane fatty-acyl-phospholipid synthase-like methyltransferase
MSVRSIVVGQFRRPHGLLGRLAGLIMATRSSNRARNAWTVGLLEIGVADRVLELGCGPGLALAGVLARATRGHVLGIDHSPLMVAQARRRNRAAIDAGRLELRCQNLADLDGIAGPFDKVLSLNVLMFLAPAQRQALFARLRALMTPGGRIAIAYQPRHRGATADDARKFAAAIAAEMRAAAFAEIRTEELALTPVAAVCVLATVPR